MRYCSCLMTMGRAKMQSFFLNITAKGSEQMKLVSTQAEVGSNRILGMSEVDARAAWVRLFDQIGPASQAFLLGMAHDMAQEDPAPKKQRSAPAQLAPLRLICG